MRKRFGNVLRISLSKTGASVVRTSGWLQTHSEILAEWSGTQEECSSPENVINKLGVLLKEVDCQGMSARVVISDIWVRRWMVVPPQNVTTISDCHAAASARFQLLFGEAISGWHLAADWDALHPFLACAIPRPLLSTLQQVANDHRLVLLEVAPHFVAAWNSWRNHLQEGIWFGVLHQKVLTFAVVGQNRPEFVRDVTLPYEAMRDQYRVPEILAREALRLNVPMPPEIRLCGQIPAHWVMQKIANLTFVRLDQNQLVNGSQPVAVSLSPGASRALMGMRL